jgi:hypothetical protein
MDNEDENLVVSFGIAAVHSFKQQIFCSSGCVWVLGKCCWSYFKFKFQVMEILVSIGIPLKGILKNFLEVELRLYCLLTLRGIIKKFRP